MESVFGPEEFTLIAEVYDRGRTLLPEAHDEWYRVLEPFVSEADLVLDVGAGTGRFATLIAERPGVQVIGIEPSIGMLRRAAGQRNPSGVVWAAASAEQLPIRPSCSDVVWLSNVVHYLDLPSAGREIARVLKPGGWALVRSQFPEHFDEVDWLAWFPTARVIDEARLPSVSDLVDAWKPHGLSLVGREVMYQVVATSRSHLGERLRHRAISTLQLISDAEFNAGLVALEADTTGESASPVHSRVDLLAFGHAAARS